MAAVIEDKDALRSSFERFAQAHVASEPAWLRARRTAAFARFVEKGLPGPHDEAWRHTPLAPLVRTQFAPADPASSPAAADLARVPREVTRGAEIVFVNGRFAPELSRLGAGAGEGLHVTSLRAALQSDGASLEPLLDRALPRDGSVFSDLNQAFPDDGACVTLAPGAVVREPIHVVHVSVPGATPTAAYQRTLLLAGRGSEARVVETFAGPDAGAYLVNAVTELLLEDGARLDHCKLQREGERGLHLATLAVRLGRDARFSDRAISLGAGLARNEIEVLFDGAGGECVLDGLFLVDGRRVCDTHSRIDHAQPHCTSRQLYKGILDQQARGVFNGLVRVRPGAQKTDAAQTNRNLLLSRDAIVHSTPQLEILADDVKCKHGSTTGQLDATALFYLRSRGIGEAAARGLLTWAFASDLLRGVPVEALRQAAEAALQAQLRGVADVREALS